MLKVRILKQKHATKENLQNFGHSFNLRSSLPGNGEWFRLVWINAHKQEITDEMIVNIVNKENEYSDNDKNRQMKISHTDGLNAIESAVEYREQQTSHPVKKNGEALLQENAKVIFKKKKLRTFLRELFCYLNNMNCMYICNSITFYVC